MNYRTLGRTGQKVSEIGHGTWTMGSMWGPRDDKAALDSLVRSLELGVTFIDTAWVYGDGHSEELIAKALKEFGFGNLTASKASERGRLHPALPVEGATRAPLIATKCPPKNFGWPARHHVPVEETFPPEHVVNYTEKSLKNLRMDCVDLQQLHVWSDNWLEKPIWLEAVEKLKKQGKIRYFGVSINDHEPDSALKIVASGLIDSVQVIYNIFDQTPEEKLFPLCQKHNVAVIARVPFDEGSLTGLLTPETQFHKGDWRQKYFTPDRLKETCTHVEKLKVLIRGEIKTLSQAALKFCLSQAAVSTVIPGMRTVAHVEENSKASDGLLLTEQERTELKNHAWPRNFYPTYG
ncbi:MAG: aldo/keto reductase [Deltaproteobacteria bacterium]|nr:aldo/keto reductase [Deltaproteobacteria bacterium]